MAFFQNHTWLRRGIYLAVGYLTTVVLFKWLQTYIMFQPTSLAADFKYQFEDTFQELNFAPNKGVRLNALYFKTKQPQSKGVVLFFHGNRDNLTRWGREYAPRFVERGYDVLMYDYRGYGKSTGLRTEVALHADAALLYNELKKTYSEDRIVLYGYSLGTGMAVQLAAQTHPQQLILEAPYTNAAALANSYLPIFPWEQVLDFQFRSDAYIARVRCPIHLFHGTADRVVPYRHSLQLCRILNKQPATVLTTIANGGHKHLVESPVYQAALDSLLLP
jgi:uncharacterized protein